jgi:restriction endonuclease HindI-like protein
MNGGWCLPRNCSTRAQRRHEGAGEVRIGRCADDHQQGDAVARAIVPSEATSTALVANSAGILAQDDGTNRLLRAVIDLSHAFALAVPHEEALRLRDDVGFFQAVRAVLAKGAAGERKTDEELDHAIRQIISKAMISDEVVDIFAAAGLKKPDISILSDEFLAEVRGMPQRNLAVELLQKLLKGEIRTRSRRNVVQARSFAEMLEQSLRRYQNRAIETARVIEELIGLAKRSRRRVHVRQGQLQARRIKRDRTLAHGIRDDCAGGRAPMVHDQRLRRIDDQVVHHTCHPEVAGELHGRGDTAGRGREHLDHDDRIRHDDRRRRQLGAAIDHRVRLVGGAVVDANRRAVHQGMAAQPAIANPLEQRNIHSALHVGVPCALGRHGPNHTVVQLVASRPVLGPGQVFVHGHARLGQYRHVRIIPCQIDRRHRRTRVKGAGRAQAARRSTPTTATSTRPASPCMLRCVTAASSYSMRYESESVRSRSAEKRSKQPASSVGECGHERRRRLDLAPDWAASTSRHQSSRI